MSFLKRLFCRHSKHGATFVRNLYGDQINEWGWMRSVWRCDRCGHPVGRPDLHEEPKAPVLSPRFYPGSRKPMTQTARTPSPAPAPRRYEDSAPSAAPSVDPWPSMPSWAAPAATGAVAGVAAAAIYESQRGGDFSGAGASGGWDAPSPCPSPSYDSGSSYSSSDSGSCSSDSGSSSSSD